MSLEQDIKQEKFESEFHKVAVNLLFTSSWLYNINADRLKAQGITPEQYNVLRILRGQKGKPANMSVIQERMISKNSNTTRLVD